MKGYGDEEGSEYRECKIKRLQLNRWKVIQITVLIRSKKSVLDPTRPESEPLQHLMRQGPDSHFKQTENEFLPAAHETWRNNGSIAAVIVD